MSVINVHQPIIIHYTVAYQAETENINPKVQAWDFNCPHCNYRATYVKRNPKLSILTIWDVGDLQVRHRNSLESEQKEEMWLTPQIRRQLEDLLQDVNMG